MAKKVSIVDFDLTKHQLINAVFQNLVTAPSNPGVGQFYFDTTIPGFCVWNGTSWEVMDDENQPRTPKSHVLATNLGLGGEHTISGASAGHALVADDATHAKFQQVDHQNLANKGANTHAQIDTHIGTANIHAVLDDAQTTLNTLWSSQKINGLIAAIQSQQVGMMVFKGGYDAATNTPNLDTAPAAGTIKQGDTYVVTVAGNFFTEAVQIGDTVIAKQNDPTTLAHWVVVNKNIPDIVDATESAKGIVELATNAESQTGTDNTRAVHPAGLKSTLDNRNASETVTGLIEIATDAEVSTGTDDLRAVTPKKLKTVLGTTATLTSARKFSQPLSTSATSYAITHGLNTTNLHVSVRDTASPFDEVEVGVKIPDANTVTLEFSEAPTANKYAVTIIG